MKSNRLVLCSGLASILLLVSCTQNTDLMSSSNISASNMDSAVSDILSDTAESDSSTLSDITSDSVSSSKNSQAGSVLSEISSGSVSASSYDEGNISIDMTDDKAPTVVLKTRVIDIKKNEQIKPQTQALGLFTEMPPWLQLINGKVKAIISTAWCGLLDFNQGKNITSTEQIFDTDSKIYLTTGGIYNYGSFTGIVSDADKFPYWRRNYYGPFNTFIVKDKNGKEYLLGVMHGENKNERMNLGSKGIVEYNNTVFPSDKQYLPSEYDGEDENGIWRESSGTYFAFSGITVAPTDVNDGTDLQNGDKGPVIWPSAGYLDERGEQASQGVRHSSGFVTNDYLYIYYLDTSKNGYEAGRYPGLKVARSPLSSLGEPGSFRNYFAGKWEEKSLPANFDKTDRTMFYKQGGRGSVILTGSTIRFSVAKVKGTSYYLGVEETFTSKGLSIMLRASTDLANWGDPVTIYNAESSQYLEGALHYPIFYNKEFTSCIEIDKDEFYVGGIYGQGSPPKSWFQYVKLSINIIEN